MKPRLKPRMFPEAGECLHDDRSFEEQMTDLGVGIIRNRRVHRPVGAQRVTDGESSD